MYSYLLIILLLIYLITIKTRYIPYRVYRNVTILATCGNFLLRHAFRCGGQADVFGIWSAHPVHILSPLPPTSQASATNPKLTSSFALPGNVVFICTVSALPGVELVYPHFSCTARGSTCRIMVTLDRCHRPDNTRWAPKPRCNTTRLKPNPGARLGPHWDRHSALLHAPYTKQHSPCHVPAAHVRPPDLTAHGSANRA